MKKELFALLIMFVMQGNVEIVRNACYIKVIENSGINNTRLLWIRQRYSKDPSYYRIEYSESVFSEDIKKTLQQELIAIAFFDSNNNQIKHSASAYYDPDLEKELIKQLDPRASLPKNFGNLLREKPSSYGVFLNDSVQRSCLDLCSLY